MRAVAPGAALAFFLALYACTPIGTITLQHGEEAPQVFSVDSRGRITSETSERPLTMNGPNPLYSPGFLQTDRWIYRPGDLIGIRAILRSGPVRDYKIPTDPVTLEITNMDTGTAFVQRTLRPDAYGTVHTEYRLPDNTKPGAYGVGIGATGAVFQVEDPRRAPALDVYPVDRFPLAGTAAVFTVRAMKSANVPAAYERLHYSFRIGGKYIRVQGFGASIVRNHDESYTRVGGYITTDANGAAQIVIPTQRASFGRAIMLTVDVPREAVSARSGLFIAPSDVDLRVTPERWVGKVGVPSRIAVQSLSREGVPLPRVRVGVRIIEMHPTVQAERDAYVSAAHIVTDANGDGSFAWTPPHPGEFRFDAGAKDSHGNAAGDSQYQLVPDPRSQWRPPVVRPEIISEQPKYQAGRPIQLLVALPVPDRDVIVALTNDYVLENRIVHVNGFTKEISFKAPQGASHLIASLFMPYRRGVAVGNASIEVDPQSNLLKIAVHAGSSHYAPGERAELDVHVTDASDKPVRAQIGLNVVNVRNAPAGVDELSMVGTFFQRAYGDMPWTSWHNAEALPDLPGQWFPGEILGWRYAVSHVRMATPLEVYGPESAFPSVGRLPGSPKFSERAFWEPVVVTDASGNARVHFVWPAQPGTWRVTAVGVTTASQMGVAVATLSTGV
jgi:alpha-2-macroglobulin